MGPAIGYIRKRLQSSYSKYIQKNETVLRKLKENTMKIIQKIENLIAIQKLTKMQNSDVKNTLKTIH